MRLRVGSRRGAWSVSVLALAAGGFSSPAAAQTAPPAPPAATATTAPPVGPPARTRPPQPAPRRPAASDEDDPADSQHARGARNQGVEIQGVDVVARKSYAQQYGAVIGDIEPEIQYTPAEIQSFGVSTLTDLINELAPEIRSDRGRGGSSAVILVNGRRISSFNEVQNIPTEAILRVDILPEEVSLKYGYTADQRVVNIVLRRRFRATTVEAVGGGSTEGGQVSGQAEVDLLHMRRDDRLNLDIKYKGASDITDADRGVIEPAPAVTPYDRTNIAPDRTLAPATQSLTANAVLTHPLPHGLEATINATLGFTSSRSLQGLPTVGLDVPAGDPFAPASGAVVVDRYGDRPLAQSAYGWTAHLGSTLNKDMGNWRLSLTNAYDHADTQTDTDTGLNAAPLNALLAADSPTFDPFSPLPANLLVSLPQAYARSISDSGNIQILANGPLLKLPAGRLYVSGKVGDTESWQGSTTARMDDIRSISLNRNDANAQLSIDIPLASRRNHFLPAIGELSVNANAAVDQLSDFGTLKTFGYGANWTPVPGWNLIVSHTNDQAAPTIGQLGGATIYTPGVPVFDYASGQATVVTQVNGANPLLRGDNRNVTKIGLTLKPIPTQELTITANYIRSTIDNPIETFPAASAAIETAFPARFVRDASGELIEEDIRPVNFARSERAELRWGIDYSRPLGKQPPPRPAFPGLEAMRRARAAAGGSPDAGGGGGGGGRGGGSGGFGRFGGGGPPIGGRLQLAVYHTMIFTDRLVTAPGGPTLDLLGGAPASGVGGQYRNEIEGQLGATLHGYGVRLSEDWREATVVQGVPGVATGDLHFSGITSLNLRLWANLGQQRGLVKRNPWLRGARVTLAVNNLLDERVQVRDSLGLTPLTYQPGLIDPVGRSISLSIRKLFF